MPRRSVNSDKAIGCEQCLPQWKANNIAFGFWWSCHNDRQTILPSASAETVIMGSKQHCHNGCQYYCHNVQWTLPLHWALSAISTNPANSLATATVNSKAITSWNSFATTGFENCCYSGLHTVMPWRAATIMPLYDSVLIIAKGCEQYHSNIWKQYRHIGCQSPLAD